MTGPANLNFPDLSFGKHATVTPCPSTVCLADSQTFSFGLAGMAAAAAPGQQAPAPEDLPQPLCEPPSGREASAPRIASGATVQGPNPFQDMLRHLNGPAYASPAPATLHPSDSPQSPLHLTPLHLISAEPGGSPLGPGAGEATPSLCSEFG